MTTSQQGGEFLLKILVMVIIFRSPYFDLLPLFQTPSQMEGDNHFQRKYYFGCVYTVLEEKYVVGTRRRCAQMISFPPYGP